MYYIFVIIKCVFLCSIIFISIPSIKNSYNMNEFSKKRNIKDALFVNGYKNKMHSSSYRYRINHQMEQLKASFIESDECFCSDIKPLMVLCYRVIIFFSCPWTDNIEKAIILAKKFNKKVLFDIDNLYFDKKYKEMISDYFLPNEKELNDDEITLIGKTLKLCDGAITTTENLEKELKYYVSNVFINHNVASEEMWKISRDSLININNKRIKENIVIGYLCETNSPEQELKTIKSVLIKILQEYKNVQLLLLGESEIEDFSNNFSDKIIKKTSKDWRKLFEIIKNIDINIAPIEFNLFNEIKNENKWIEASLFKIPTIASNFGVYKKVIIHNETGILCSDMNDWYIHLKSLINNESLRKAIGEKAFNFCKIEYDSISNGYKLANFINSFANKHIGFYLPSLDFSGGLYVIIKHASILRDNGWDVDLILPEGTTKSFDYQEYKLNIISLSNTIITAQYDIIVATFYKTLFSILNYYKTKKRLYLVQGYETNFYPYGDYYRSEAEKTYLTNFDVKYITISKWCQNWLFEKYSKTSRYSPNGIDLANFTFHRRNLNKQKIRILIEGDSSSHYKNVDESFKIIENLDKNKFEVWYLSYKGNPKNWYYINKFFKEIPHEKVLKIYSECDILLKSSFLESFSYPPLEMMATGGYCIVAPNEGNEEYLINEENCLLYKLGDINSGVECINRLISDDQLQQRLYKNGLSTAKKRDWKFFQNQIIALYQL